MQKLLDLVYSKDLSNWSKRAEDAFGELWGSNGGRYPQAAGKTVAVRSPEVPTGVSFAALIHPSNPTSGPYGGSSFVLFPSKDAPCLITMVVGTQGLSPDEEILSRPGHARKVAAICKWLNHAYGHGDMVAWSKHDPTRIDLEIPQNVARKGESYQEALKRYGKVIYGLYAPGDDRQATTAALKSMLDLTISERGHQPLAAHTQDARDIETLYFAHLLSNFSRDDIAGMLTDRRYVILQGPPGTGKTHMALELLRHEYNGRGMSVQLHPNTTYENFVGGLAPVEAEQGMGFKFAPLKGYLMQAIEEALSQPNKPFLLHIDEVNRADLGKVLGEAIFLLEPQPAETRSVRLPYDFGGVFGNTLMVPPNLHIIGTMNTADRSIALVDIAVRRRFSFCSLWPQMSVVKEHGGELMQEAFGALVDLWVEHANEESFALMPGHSYFLEKDDKKAQKRLKQTLLPLLEEYLAQGYIAGFAEVVRGYVQQIESALE
jgi:5-methylcytosine-specific restriction protein B